MKNVFSSTQNPSWHPPGTRSIYGGTVIAQSLAAASSTLQSPSFQVHSMHCYFIRRASSDEAIFFYVEATSDGYSFANRTIQARQNGAVVATATVSFTLSRREKQGYLRHFSPIATSAAGGNIKHDIPGSVGDPVEIQSGAEEALESCISRTLNSKTFQLHLKKIDCGLSLPQLLLLFPL
jgi:acyl-CoA thioesterase II